MLIHWFPRAGWIWSVRPSVCSRRMCVQQYRKCRDLSRTDGRKEWSQPCVMTNCFFFKFMFVYMHIHMYACIRLLFKVFWLMKNNSLISQTPSFDESVRVLLVRNIFRMVRIMYTKLSRKKIIVKKWRYRQKAERT